MSTPPSLSVVHVEDYGEALVHAGWLVGHGRRILIFGFVELFPVEQTSVDGVDEQFVRSDGCRGYFIYFSRIRMPASQAFSIYQNAACGEGLVLPVDGDSGAPTGLELSQCLVEPMWPNLSLSMGGPYIPFGVQPRSHHLLPGSIGEELKRLLTNEADVEWLKDRFYFSLVEFEELMGSFHLLAHNPVYRDMHVKLRRSEAGVESVSYNFELRQQQSLDGLTLYQIEKRLGDSAGFQEVRLTTPTFSLPLSGVADEVEHIVCCQERGMLEKSQPCGFMRQISFSLGLHSGKTAVSVSGRGGVVDDNYVVDRVSYDKKSVFGETEVPEAMRLYSSKKRSREIKRQAAELGQQWFENDYVKARNYVRGLISKARSRVWIIDPYFTNIDLFRFALATTSPAVKMVIATSAEVLKNFDSVEDQVEAGVVLSKNLEQFKSDYSFSVRVLTGDRSPIHDRFLVIDDVVWFLGNSLNSLGSRAGMMVKLPDPSQVLGRLEGILFGDRSQKLDTWVENRKSATQEDLYADS